jgi:uncharacterized protein YaaW (UPF0174 family)
MNSIVDKERKQQKKRQIAKQKKKKTQLRAHLLSSTHSQEQLREEYSKIARLLIRNPSAVSEQQRHRKNQLVAALGKKICDEINKTLKEQYEKQLEEIRKEEELLKSKEEEILAHKRQRSNNDESIDLLLNPKRVKLEQENQATVSAEPNATIMKDVPSNLSATVTTIGSDQVTPALQGVDSYQTAFGPLPGYDMQTAGEEDDGSVTAPLDAYMPISLDFNPQATMYSSSSSSTSQSSIPVSYEKSSNEAGASKKKPIKIDKRLVPTSILKGAINKKTTNNNNNNNNNIRTSITKPVIATKASSSTIGKSTAKTNEKDTSNADDILNNFLKSI